MSLRNIKIVIRNFIIIIFYLTGLPYLRVIYYQMKKKPLTRIICFHGIKDRSIFKKKILFFKKYYSVISIEDFIKGKLDLKKINIIITFDDGYKSWIENAIPVLEELNTFALFFVNSESCGKNEQELSKSDIMNLSKRKLFYIGSHGKNHLDISKLNKIDLEEEIVEDKKNLENIINKEIKFYAFPFGHIKNFNKNVFNYFDCVFSIIPGFNLGIIKNKVFRRDSLDPNYSNILFKAWLLGSYDLYWYIKNIFNFKD